MGNRVKATDVAVSLMAELFPKSGNDTMLRADLDRLSDAEFDALMEKIRLGVPMISATLPNLMSPVVKNFDLLAVAKKWGVEFFQNIEMEDPETKEIFTTPIRYMVIREVIPRLQQMIEDKQSIPDDSSHIDDLTGQVTGPSKGSRISFQELNNMASTGADVSILEMVSVRGGDQDANRKLENDILMTGTGTVEAAKAFGSGVTSTKNFATLLRVAHLDNTLDK